MYSLNSDISSDSLIQVPFEHESLLIDQKEELDESEKELAMRGTTVKLNHHFVQHCGVGRIRERKK